MNRNTGIMGAIALVIAAIFGLSSLPSSKEKAAAISEATKSSEVAVVSREEAVSPCQQIKRAIAEFLPWQSVVLPSSCGKEATQSKGGESGTSPARNSLEVRYVIATLPDPVHTHFPLLFDRLTEALQQGAQDQDYSYDDSWLPWGDQDAGQTAQARQEDQPGVLVFRKALPGASTWNSCKPSPGGNDPPLCPEADEMMPYRKGLIVFVVGENPTGGINLDQFHNAVCWVQSLQRQRKDSKLGILGPYFSGSFPSLARAVKANNLLAWPAAAPECGPQKAASGADAVKPAPNAQESASTGSGKAMASQEISAAQAQEDKGGAAASTGNPLTILSGSVTSLPGIDWFNQFLKDSKAPGIFHSFQENDDLMIDRYCKYLSVLGYDVGKLAILSEDETAYGATSNVLPDCEYPPDAGSVAAGGSPKAGNSATGPEAKPLSKAKHGPLYLYYPRDIAALRAAYETQSPSSGSSSPTQSGDQILGLPFKLVEPGGRQHDTIRTYGGAETPLSQESVLFGITKLFSSHGIQFIVLRSSNTLDQIFLTQFFSKSYPQARVILTSSDLLFRRGSETAGFRGTMTLNTYPLFSWQQDWTFWQSYEARHSHRIFSQDSAEGLYLATRFLIDGQPCTQECTQEGCFELKGDNAVAVQDYALPSWLLLLHPPVNGLTRPPTWLSVIGNEQFWSVAVLDDDLFMEASKTPERPASQTAARPASTLPFVRTEAPAHSVYLPLLLPMTFLMVVNLLWASGHFFGCWMGSKSRPQLLLAPARFLLNFTPMRARQRQQRKLMFVGGLVLTTVAVILTSACGGLYFARSAAGEPLLLLGGKRLLAFTGFALLASGVAGFFFYCVRSRNAAKHRPRWRRDLLWFLCMCVVSGYAFWWAFPHQIGPDNSIPAYWRSLNPLNGVAPVVPMFLVMVGLYGWFWFSLRGLALFNSDRPRLPRYPSASPQLEESTIPFRLNLGRQIERFATPLRQHYGRNLFLVVMAIVICKLLFFTAHPEQSSGLQWVEELLQAFGIRSLGECWYGGIFFLYLSISIGLILLEAWRLLFTWGRLRQLLGALDELPLRRTLVKLKGFSWNTVWQMSSNVCEQRDRLIARQMESLRHLQNQLPEFPQTSAREKAIVDELRASLAFCDAVVADYSGLRQAPASKTLCPIDPAGKPDHFAKLPKTQAELATATTAVLDKFLIDTWQEDKYSLIRRSSTGDNTGEKAETPKEGQDTPGTAPPEYVSAAEEFVALPYLAFIQNILGRIRTMALSMMFLFVMAAFSVASYPFDPRPELGGMFLVIFAVIAGVVIFVYGQMHRDATLSNITNTNPGELGSQFWIKIIALGAGPVFALLATLFPQISTFITSWLQPGVQAIK